MVSYREASEGAQRIAGDNWTSLTEAQRSELVRSYCCEACTEASVMTGQPGTTVFNGPFVGRSIGQLVHGDVIRTPSSERPHVLGDVSVDEHGATVIWRDRTERESLTGAMALSVLRLEELPSVPGAGLMPINGELVEMEDKTGRRQLEELLSFE
jgi:hypothetical protein